MCSVGSALFGPAYSVAPKLVDPLGVAKSKAVQNVADPLKIMRNDKAANKIADPLQLTKKSDPLVNPLGAGKSLIGA